MRTKLVDDRKNINYQRKEKKNPSKLKKQIKKVSKVFFEALYNYFILLNLINLEGYCNVK